MPKPITTSGISASGDTDRMNSTTGSNQATGENMKPAEAARQFQEVDTGALCLY